MGLIHLDQVAFIVHMQHRLHVQRRAQQCRRRADPAAPFQIFQIFHRKPVAEMQFVRFHGVGVLVQAHALVPVLHRQVNKQSLTGGSAQGIHHADLPVRILFRKLRRNLFRVFAGHAQAAGKGQIQDVLSRFEEGRENVLKGVLVNAGGLGHPAVPHFIIKLVHGLVLIQVFLPVVRKQIRQADQFHIPFLQLFWQDIARGIRNHYIRRCHLCFLLMALVCPQDNTSLYHASPFSVNVQQKNNSPS